MPFAIHSNDIVIKIVPMLIKNIDTDRINKLLTQLEISNINISIPSQIGSLNSSTAFIEISTVFFITLPFVYGGDTKANYR